MTVPPFIFSISEIRQTRGTRQRFDSNGLWLPPRTQGASSFEPTDMYRVWYCFDGSGLNTYPYMPYPTAKHYRTSSVYTDGARFWSVPYDAVQNQVGNGRDDESEDDEDAPGPVRDPRFWCDWKPLHFDYPDHYTQATSISFPGSYPRLLTHHEDQAWVEKLFPLHYHSSQPTSDPSQGGLIGDLSLLLALIAFSVRPNAVRVTLGQVIRNQLPWHPPTGMTGRGWQDFRGVMVIVYVLPDWEESLRAFENGNYGRVFE